MVWETPADLFSPITRGIWFSGGNFLRRSVYLIKSSLVTWWFAIYSTDSKWQTLARDERRSITINRKLVRQQSGKYLGFLCKFGSMDFAELSLMQDTMVIWHSAGKKKFIVDSTKQRKAENKSSNYPTLDAWGNARSMLFFYAILARTLFLWLPISDHTA